VTSVLRFNQWPSKADALCPATDADENRLLLR
jgi:hypothetical protein